MFKIIAILLSFALAGGVAATAQNSLLRPDTITTTIAPPKVNTLASVTTPDTNTQIDIDGFIGVAH